MVSNRDSIETWCPVITSARILAKEWCVVIVDRLFSGPKRFSELQRSVNGIAPKVLSEALKHLEHEGIIVRNVENTYPVRITYELTPKGAELQKMVKELSRWAEKWLAPKIS
jgi:DNA-binding HxlR family transcriptional regulator